MTLWKKIFIFGIIPTLFALTTTAFYLEKKKSALSPPVGNEFQSVSSLSVTLKANPSAIGAGNKISIDVLIEGNLANSVSAANLQLSYPANLLKLISGQLGSIWTKAIKLKYDVNPELGTAGLSIGRGIEAENTASPVLATFDFQVISSSSAEIKVELEKSSRFARLGGVNQPVPYQAAPLITNINPPK